MKFIKITSLTVILVATVVHSEKKIELEDIEADNLKSEKDNDNKINEQTNAQIQDALPIELLKYGYLYDKTYEKPIQTSEPRYVHQYAVNEIPEFPTAPSGPQKTIALATVNHQPMVGYLPGMPLQLYLVPQYQADELQSTGIQALSSPLSAEGQSYYSVDPVQQNIVEIPTFNLIDNDRKYPAQYSKPLTYIKYGHQQAATTVNPQISVVTMAPTTLPQTPKSQFTFQIPFSHYSNTLVAPPVASRGQVSSAHLPRSNAIEDTLENEVDPRQYAAHQYKKPEIDNNKYYMVKNQEDQATLTTPQLPSPSLLLLRGPNQQLPKALPFRPMPKPIYPPNIYSKHIAPRPFNPHQKRRPTSLIDSYIPSSVQVEYMKRGNSKDPMSAYEALSSSRHIYPHTVSPRQLERGFLPNQMYQTASGGITFGHYKRASKPIS